MKYGQLFADQSKDSERTAERMVNARNKMRIETTTFDRTEYSRTKQREQNRTKCKTYIQAVQNERFKVKSSIKTKVKNYRKGPEKILPGAKREIMEIIRKRNKSPETRMLVEQRNTLSRPGTLRRRYDSHSRRTTFAPSRTNEHSREQIAKIDAELL